MARNDSRRVKPRGDAQLTAADREALERIEALYGPIGRSESAAEASASDQRPGVRRVGTAGSVLRTLLFVSAAFLVWYALAGGEASVQRLLEPLSGGNGEERPASEPEPSPEYVLASRVLRVDRLALDDPLVLQFKVLLDALAPKCREDRVRLASAVIDAHAAKLSRGVEMPMISLLAQTDASLTEPTRSSWPTNCAELLGRF